MDMERIRARAVQLREQLMATPRRRRWLKVTGIVLTVWLLLCLLVWLLAPGFIRDYAVQYVRDEFGHDLALGEVKVNPVLLALTLRELDLRDSQHRSLVSFREMVVDVDIQTLVRGMVVLDEFSLDGLVLNVERLGADRFNFSDLADRLAARAAAAEKAAPAAPAATAETAEPAVHFLIRKTALTDAAFRFVDHTHVPAFENWLRPINMAMEDLTSRPDREAPYDLEATIGSGGAIGWRGDLSLQPLRSQGRLELRGFGLKAVHDYMKSQFAFSLPSGTMDVRVDYLADFSGTQSVLRITDGSVSIDRLAITDTAENPLFAFDKTQATGIVADLMRSTLTVGLVETLGGRVEAVVNADGSTNIERALLPPPGAEPLLAVTAETPPAPPAPVQEPPAAGKAADGKTDTAPAAPVWTITVTRAALRDYVLHLVDNSTVPAADLTLGPVAFTAENLRLPDTAPVPFTLEAVLGAAGDAGSLSVKGSYTLDGGALAAELALKDIALKPFSPYLGSVGRISLGDGRVNWSGRLSALENGTRDLKFEGSGKLQRLLVLDEIRKAKLLRLGELGIEGFVYEDRVPRLALRRLILAGLDVDVAVDRNGVLNLQDVFAVPAVEPVSPAAATTAAATSPAVAAQKPATEKPMAMRLDSLVIRDTTVNVRDASPDISFSMQLAGFGGRIDGLSSDPSKRAKVDLSGTIDRYAPLAITGEINPLAAVSYSDVRVRLASLDLSALTPYTVTWIAYPLERGKMGVELDWKIAERKFESQNRLLLDGLALGEKREAPRATKLPVKLGIALLTNRDGDADLSVPAYGELDDPKFRIGRVILAALGNLVTRAATAPFAMLGGGGDGDKAGQVLYAPGSSRYAATEADKLAKIAQSLLDRPMLSLSVTGTASAAGDRDALQQAALERQLKTEYLDSPFRRGQNPDDVVLTAEQRAGLLATLYQRRTGKRLAELAGADGLPLPPSGQQAQAEAVLRDGIAIDDGALRELARQRAQRVKDALLAAGVPEARLFVVDGEIVAGTASPDGIPTRLALDAK